MKKRNKKVHALVFTLVFSVFGLSAAQAQPNLAKPVAEVKQQDEDAGRWLLTQMAMQESLRQIPEGIATGLQQAQMHGMPSEIAAVIQRSAYEVYNMDELEPQALSLLLNSLSNEHLQTWMAFYKTPLGQKVAMADIKGSSAETFGFIFENGPVIMAELAQDTARLALIQSLVDSTQVLDQVVSVSLAMGLSLEWAMISAMPDQQGKPTFQEVQQFMEEQRFVMRSQMAQMVLAHAAHTRKDMTISELQEMLTLANSPAGQAMFRDFGQLFAQWLNHYAQRLGDVVGQELSQTWRAQGA